VEKDNFIFSIDTNVLVRYLAQDHAQQSAIASELLDSAYFKNIGCILSSGVLTETVWVLMRLYNVKKKEIINILQTLVDLDVFTFEMPVEFIADAIEHYKKYSCGFSDCLIIITNQYIASEKNCRTMTLSFDKKAIKAGMTPIESVLAES